MPSKPPASLLLDWITAAWALTPTTEPVAIGVLWRDNGVLKYSAGIPPVITDEPDNVSPNEGDTATFSVVATNATGYQWQLNTGSGWHNITGATSASYTTGVLSLSDNAHQFRCVVTGLGGTDTSSAATITMFNPISLPSPAFIIPMTEGSGQIAYNLVGGYTSGDTNKWHAPENLKYWGWQTGGSSVTDRYADFNSGDSAATRLNLNSGQAWSADRGMRMRQSVQVTVSFYYKATTGSSTAFRFYRPSAFTALTATNTWQRYSQTWTPSLDTDSFQIYASAGSASDILVYGVKVEEAATASTYLRPECHLRISNLASDVAWVTEGLNITSASRVAAIIRNAAVTQSAFTFHCAFQYLGTNKLTEYQILCDLSQANFWVTASAYTGAAAEQNIRILNGARVGPRGTDISDGQWHILTGRYNGAVIEMFVDGCLQESRAQTGTYTSFEFNPFGYVASGNGSLGAIGKYAYFAWFDEAHSNANMQKTVRFINSVMVSRGITRTVNSYVVYEGDSITEGTTYVPLLTYADRSVANLTAGTRVGVNAVSGSTVATLSARASSVDACVGVTTLATKNVLVVMIGTNDLSGAPTAATFLTNLKAYTAARIAAGWRVVVCSIPPSSDATRNGKRATVHAEFANAGNIGVYWHAFAAWHTDATVGVDAAGSNATYYPDGTHPSNAAHALIEPYITSTINTLLASL